MDFKTATKEELHSFANEKREELRGLRFSSAGSKNNNVKLASTLRKEIARAETALSAQK